MTRRPPRDEVAAVLEGMRPVEKDVFAVAGVGTVTLRRSAGGAVTEVSVKQDHVRDPRFLASSDPSSDPSLTPRIGTVSATCRVEARYR